MRKKRRAFLLGLMAMFLVGGVATTLALTYHSAEQNIAGTSDSAIYLKWGHNELEAVGDLVAGTPQYRDVTLDADKSASVTGSAQVTFTLALIDADSTLTGLSVAIYHGTRGVGVNDMTLLKTLTSSASTYTDTVAFTDNAANRDYRLAITYDGSMAETNKVIEGKITIALGHAV